jgi:hypothetical protein
MTTETEESSAAISIACSLVIACIAMLMSTSVQAAPPAVAAELETAVMTAAEHGFHSAAATGNRQAIANTSRRLLDEGRSVFRFETFGDEAWWTDTLRLHEAIEGKNHGGVGAGVSPATALAVGLKVDIDALPKKIQKAIARGEVDLNDPAVTLVLLKLDAVLGIKATLRHDKARAHQQGTGSVRRMAGQGRQGFPSRRCTSRNAAATGLRPGRCQPAHLDRIRVSSVLECVCRSHPDAWNASDLL